MLYFFSGPQIFCPQTSLFSNAAIERPASSLAIGLLGPGSGDCGLDGCCDPGLLPTGMYKIVSEHQFTGFKTKIRPLNGYLINCYIMHQCILTWNDRW